MNIYSLLSSIAVFFIIVLFHELGHFSVAKFFDVKVNEFLIGFGPVLFKKQYGETLYSIRLFPLGGAVMMEGEDEDSDDERAYHKKKAWQKFLIVIAGPLMNFVVAIFLLFVIFLTTGYLGNQIMKVNQDSPAFLAGLQSGDRIVRIDDTKVEDWNTIIQKIKSTQGETVEVEVIRDSKPEVLTMTPVYNQEQARYLIGISEPMVEKKALKAFQMSYAATRDMTVETFKVLGRIFHDPEVQKGISGPVGIYNAIDYFAKQGIISLMSVTAVISINLGIVNLLPIPALDGGRMILLLFEMITRRKINQKFEDNLHKIGFILLLALMVIVLIKDIVAPAKIVF